MPFGIPADLMWRLLSGGLGLLNIGSQARTQRKYETDQDQLRADVLDYARRVGPETMATYDDSSMQQLGALQDMQRRAYLGTQDLYRNTKQGRGEFLQDLDSRARSLLRGYQDRYNRAEQDITGYGAQMREDIDRGAEENRARFALNPLSRGSTIASSVNRNIEEGRTAEQRRLGEDLVRQRVGLLSGLSGEQLNAQGQADASRAAFDSALRGQLLDTQRYGFETGQNAAGNIANFYGGNAINRSGLTNQGMNTYLSALSNYNLVPPQPPNLQGLGAGLIQPAQPPSFWDSAGPGILSGGLQAGGMLGAATIIAVGVCIGEDSLIEGPDGEKSLRDIRVGDWAFDFYGEPKRVIGKHLAQYSGDDWDDQFLQIRIKGKIIVASMDHVIEDATVREWCDCYEHQHVEPCPAGDILLEDGSDYRANGLRIRSMIRHEDLPLLYIVEPENQLNESLLSK